MQKLLSSGHVICGSDVRVKRNDCCMNQTSKSAQKANLHARRVGCGDTKSLPPQEGHWSPEVLQCKLGTAPSTFNHRTDVPGIERVKRLCRARFSHSFRNRRARGYCQMSGGDTDGAAVMAAYDTCR